MINEIKYEISRINIVCEDKSAKAGILEKKGTLPLCSALYFSEEGMDIDVWLEEDWNLVLSISNISNTNLIKPAVNTILNVYGSTTDFHEECELACIEYKVTLQSDIPYRSFDEIKSECSDSGVIVMKRVVGIHQKVKLEEVVTDIEAGAFNALGKAIDYYQGKEKIYEEGERDF